MNYIFERVTSQGTSVVFLAERLFLGGNGLARLMSLLPDWYLTPFSFDVFFFLRTKRDCIRARRCLPETWTREGPCFSQETWSRWPRKSSRFVSRTPLCLVWFPRAMSMNHEPRTRRVRSDAHSHFNFFQLQPQVEGLHAV